MVAFRYSVLAALALRVVSVFAQDGSVRLLFTIYLSNKHYTCTTHFNL